MFVDSYHFRDPEDTDSLSDAWGNLLLSADVVEKTLYLSQCSSYAHVHISDAVAPSTCEWDGMDASAILCWQSNICENARVLHTACSCFFDNIYEHSEASPGVILPLSSESQGSTNSNHEISAINTQNCSWVSTFCQVF